MTGYDKARREQFIAESVQTVREWVKKARRDMASDNVPMAATSISDALGEHYPLTFRDIPGLQKHFQAHLTLADGSPVTMRCCAPAK